MYYIDLMTSSDHDVVPSCEASSMEAGEEGMFAWRARGVDVR
jgi:hypothetical protein